MATKGHRLTHPHDFICICLPSRNLSWTKKMVLQVNNYVQGIPLLSQFEPRVFLSIHVDLFKIFLKYRSCPQNFNLVADNTVLSLPSSVLVIPRHSQAKKISGTSPIFLNMFPPQEYNGGLFLIFLDILKPSISCMPMRNFGDNSKILHKFCQ